ncbi:hypothetical protein ACF090_43180 [Streptomyces sp. NPDC014892]|uniref:hypothetical protein n=1 Tax=Streptomyces sp. NPDC014892 TaxID=3364930 RepID=UPI0037015598
MARRSRARVSRTSPRTSAPAFVAAFRARDSEEASWRGHVEAARARPWQIQRATDYVELVWGSRGGEQDRAALAEFHADGLELALLIGEFGALLLTDYISVVPDEHTDCDAGHVLGDLVALTSRYLRTSQRTSPPAARTGAVHSRPGAQDAGH